MPAADPRTEKNILSFVNEFYFKNLRAPSLREIEAATGYSRQTAQRYLKKMDSEGILSYDGKMGKIITEAMEKRQSESAGMVQIPVIGKIACGSPTEQQEQKNGSIDFPVTLLGPGDFFVLEAYGDSMKEAGIFEGDLVIAKRSANASYGDIIVAIDENNENTLKTLLYDKAKGRPYLHPENSSYSDIYPNEIKIQGVAVKVIKNL